MMDYSSIALAFIAASAGYAANFVVNRQKTQRDIQAGFERFYAEMVKLSRESGDGYKIVKSVFKMPYNYSNQQVTEYVATTWHLQLIEMIYQNKWLRFFKSNSHFNHGINTFSEKYGQCPTAECSLRQEGFDQEFVKRILKGVKKEDAPHQ